MSTTNSQDKQFAENVFGRILEECVSWISANLAPQEVYSSTDLISWAGDQDIEDIFSEPELDKWAADNGYVKEADVAA